MSSFDKDDYLKDLPDPNDPILKTHGAGTSGAAGHGSREGSGKSGESVGQMTGQEANMSKDTENDNGADGVARSDDDTAQNAADEKHNADSEASASSEATESDDAGDASQNRDDSASKGDGSDEDGQSADSLTPLGKAKKEAADYLEALQRERAEFVNFRNRAKKEQDVFRQHGIIDVLTALLPALDDIDRVREHSDMDDSFAAVATKIDKAFAKFGVEKFGEKGEDFDPTRHEAILHKPDADATKETVDTVVEAGYRIGDRVIRAARVVVASPQS